MPALRLWNGLLPRSIAITLATFVVVAVLTLSYARHVAHERASAESAVRLAQLLDTVESTLRVACFVKNHELAREVATGLLSNSEVLRVTIHEGNQRLTDLQRGHTGLLNTATPAHALQRDIRSPFIDDEIIGSIWLTPDPGAIDRRIQEDMSERTAQLAGQLALIAGAMVVTLLVFVIHPIRAMSKALHGMDPTTGERLPVPPLHASTEIGRLAGDVNDLSDRLVQALDKEHTLRLQREVEERKYHALFEKAENGIFIVDRRGIISSWNPAFANLMNIPPAGNSPAWQPLTALNWESPEAVAQLLTSVFEGGTAAALDVAVRTGEYARRWLNVAFSPVADNLLQGVVHDVSQLKEAENEARRQAITDPLTGLSNRAGLERHLHEIIAGQPAAGFTLLQIDLDKFRLIIEGQGIEAGDDILRAAASRLAANIKRRDTLARLSADIYAVVLHDLVQGNAIHAVVDRILAALRQAFMVDGSPLRLTASIGITRFPDDGGDIPSLLRHAELAVDKAKVDGGNQAAFFDAQLARQAEQRRHLDNDLRMAVRERHFVLHYQPIVDLPAGRLAGAEALIRWRHPERGLVPPDQFIPVVEQSGLIDEIGLWVLDSACAQLAGWQRAGLDWYLSINVSGRQIPGGLPPAAIAEAIDRHAIAPERLVLEITEGVLLDNIEQSRHWLEAVQRLGIRVYLDDFGTGYSSLSYLKRFPLDTLKIDRSFVQDMQPGNSEHSLVQAIIAMARSLGLKVVAEGVESQLHLDMLHALGCHYAQGYHLSRPLPAEDFMAAARRIDESLATRR